MPCITTYVIYVTIYYRFISKGKLQLHFRSNKKEVHFFSFQILGIHIQKKLEKAGASQFMSS